MTIEAEIQALVDAAEPLRALPEGEQWGLNAIVEQINALRAVQAAGDVSAARAALADAQDAAAVAGFAAVVESVAPKRGPGRPRKTPVEGEDA